MKLEELHYAVAIRDKRQEALQMLKWLEGPRQEGRIRLCTINNSKYEVTVSASALAGVLRDEIARLDAALEAYGVEVTDSPTER